jgi:hypothetical protein
MLDLHDHRLVMRQAPCVCPRNNDANKFENRNPGEHIDSLLHLDRPVKPDDDIIVSRPSFSALFFGNI